MRAIVLADGSAPSRTELDEAWPGWDRDVRLVVAADGGARHAVEFGLRIDAWVGDADSLDDKGREALRDAGVPVDPVSPEKDASDGELAILEARRRGATDITIVGATGGRRQDHAYANVTLLAHPALARSDARLLDGTSRVTLLRGDASRDRVELTGRVGDLVTLLPLGGTVDGVTVAGLRYPLHGDRLEAGSTRGLSNVRTATQCRIEIDSGWLLVVETPATLRP